MALKHYLLGLLLGLGTITAVGCAVDPPPPPDPPLSKTEVDALLQCQTTIKQQGRKFLNMKVQNLEFCADDVLALQLPLESNLITQEQFDTALPKVRKKCEQRFIQINKASTKLIDSIITACKPVEDILLSEDDPLLFQGLAGIITGSEFTSVEQIAGLICATKELAADFAVPVEVPRLHQLLEILGPQFVNDLSDNVSIGDTSFGGDGLFLPAIPLDPRCALAG